jgi:hypothetical protein
VEVPTFCVEVYFLRTHNEHRTINRIMRVPVTIAWRVLRLWMEETASRYRGKLRIAWYKQPLIADKGWSSRLGVGRGADITRRKLILFRTLHISWQSYWGQ